MSISSDEATTGPYPVLLGWLSASVTTSTLYEIPYALAALRAQAPGTTTYAVIAQRSSTYNLGSVAINPSSFTGVCIRN